MAEEKGSPFDESPGAEGAAATANLVEIFSSIQGEGPDLGAATLFVRFGGCDLRCRWCDSPHTWQPSTLANRFAIQPLPQPRSRSVTGFGLPSR